MLTPPVISQRTTAAHSISNWRLLTNSLSIIIKMSLSLYCRCIWSYAYLFGVSGFLLIKGSSAFYMCSETCYLFNSKQIETHLVAELRPNPRTKVKGWILFAKFCSRHCGQGTRSIQRAAGSDNSPSPQKVHFVEKSLSISKTILAIKQINKNRKY